MKKIFSFLSFVLITFSSFSQTTATNFNCNDCSGINHDLFAELNDGKVIVIDWVMPCSSCVGPSKTAYNIVQSYASSNPGKVMMYIADDYANNSCTQLSSWVDQNSMPNTTRFSNSIIKMTDYGSNGMPKIIIVGGINHTVFYNEINTEAGNVAKLQAGINAALTAASISKNPLSDVSISISPNPAITNANVFLTLKNSVEVTVEVFNSVGQKVMTVINNELLAQGKNEIEISTEDISEGLYLVKVTEPFGTKTIRLVVSH